MAPTYIGDFNLKGSDLREKGINRIGNLLVPNDNYCLFEDWVMPVLDKLLDEQKKTNQIWSPSKIITRLGETINNEESICHWAAVNKIPIFCPSLTDGSLGDMIYFHTFKNPGLIIDITQGGLSERFQFMHFLPFRHSAYQYNCGKSKKVWHVNYRGRSY